MIDELLPIYFVNLNTSTDRMNNTLVQCSQANINCIRFPAINGYNVLIQDSQNQSFSGKYLKDNNLKLPSGNNYKIICEPGLSDSVTFNITGDGDVTAGQLGGHCSFLGLMKKAKNESQENIAIFEDDILIFNKEYFANKLINFFLHLPNSFDFAFAGYNIKKGVLEPYNSSVVSVGSPNFLAFGMHCVIVSKKGMDKYLSYETFDYTAKDIFVWYHSITSERYHTGNPFFEVFASTENLAGQNYSMGSIISEMGRE